MKRKNLFFILIILFNLAANYAHPITPTYIKDLHLSDAMFGYVFAMMSFGMFISSPFWGKMSTVISSKVMILIGCTGYSLGQFLFMIGINPIFILIARLISGLSCGAFFVGILTYIANHSPENERGKDLTLNATIQTVAGAIGYFIGGTLGKSDIHIPFTIQVIQLFAVGVIFYVILDKDYFEQVQTFSLKEINPFKAFLDTKNYMNQSLFILFTLSTFVFLGFTALDQSFNYYLKDIFKLTSNYNGMFKAIVGFLSLLFNMTICLWIMKHTKLEKSQIVVLSILTALLILLVIINIPIYFIIIELLFAGIYAIIIPITQNIILETKGHRNEKMGFYQSTKSLGMILGSSISGIIYSFNAKFPFILAACFFILALLLALIYQKIQTNR